MATYRDFQMVNEGLDSLGRAVRDRRDRRDRRRERDEDNDLRRQAMEQNEREAADNRDYRNRSLDASKEEAAARVQAQREHNERLGAQGDERNAMMNAQHQVEQRSERVKRMQGTLDWLKDGVVKGVIPPDKAASVVREATKQLPPEELAGTPFAVIDDNFFQTPKVDDGKMDFIEDPVTGERFARRGNQTLKSGVNPEKARMITEAERRATIEQESAQAARDKIESEMGQLETKAKPIRDKIQSGNRFVGPEFLGIGDRQKDLDPIEQEIARKKVELQARGQVPAPGKEAVASQLAAPQAPERQVGAMHGVVKPQTREEVMRLPKGVKFLNPADGKIYIKQ